MPGVYPEFLVDAAKSYDFEFWMTPLSHEDDVAVTSRGLLEM